MKINYLQISNILSFEYHSDIVNAPKINFDPNLNILIGHNGSGKSTALEVINLIFKKVLFIQINVNQDLHLNEGSVDASQRKTILQIAERQHYHQFRLDPNWSFENKEQKIRIEIVLDEIDRNNIQTLKNNAPKLSSLLNKYSNSEPIGFEVQNTKFILEISLDRMNNQIVTYSCNHTTDPGFQYLVKYNLYKELIKLYNIENPTSQLPTLYESFALIGGYRNYHSFNRSVSLQQSTASRQVYDIRAGEFIKSLNASDQGEPPIFNLVRLRDC
jgi:predicted ATP-dependent endonuclease of OLD family